MEILLIALILGLISTILAGFVGIIIVTVLAVKRLCKVQKENLKVRKYFVSQAEDYEANKRR